MTLNDTQPKTSHILVFEPLEGGHRFEFLSHLLKCIQKSNENGKHFTFIVAKALPDSLANNNISIIEISAQEKDALSRSRGPLAGLTSWRILNRYLKDIKPDHLLILDLTSLELPLCFKRTTCPFSGILFVQYPELRPLRQRGWRIRMKFQWKELKTGRFLRNSRPEKVFLLNGEKSCKYLNSRFNTDCYRPIPDPVPEIFAEPGADIRRQHGISEDMVIFLFFGSMSSRKGVEPLVAGLANLSKRSAKKSVFLFCGQPEPNYESRYCSLLDSLQRKRPDISIHIEDKFATVQRMRALFEQSDWILLPYTRPEYSSGILAHAAAATTPVIAPHDGLIGRQVRDFQLGLNTSSNDLSQTIEGAALKTFKFDESTRRAFVDASDPTTFARILLDL